MRRHAAAAQRNKSSDESRERPPSEAGRSRRRRPVDNASATRSHSTDQRRGSHAPKPNLDNKRSAETHSKSMSSNSRRDKSESIKSFSGYVGMFKAKILVIGPRECGKTVISNFLADATEISGGEYHPTQGARILEFESSGINVGGKEVSCEVELWDCSGDQKFENCWPAIQKDVNGILFVYNPDKINHGKELETLYVHFVEQQGLKDSQCMLFAHHRPGANEKTRLQTPSGHLSKVQCVQTNLEDDADMVKQKFNDLLAILLRNWTERRDQEELSIMNH